MPEYTYVALLRGINLGGRHRVPMKALAEMFTALGCGAVQSYIQSGNVVFRAGKKTGPQVAAAVSARIQETYGFAAPIVLRTREQLARVVGGNPFVKVAADPATVHVTFLDCEPHPDALRGIDPGLFLPDEFAVDGEHVYMRLPNGMGRAKLPMVLGAKLGAGCTTRNWRTVMKLLAMMEE